MMEFFLKWPQAGSLLFFCGWLALAATKDPLGINVQIDSKTIENTAMMSMTEGRIMQDLAAAATKNQGGAKAIKGIKGLKVTNICPPEVEITFIVNKGIRMCYRVNITVAGKSFIGGDMKITVVANLTTISNLKRHPTKNITLDILDCTVVLISCKTNLPSSMLPKIVNKFLNSTLVKILPSMMCPAADKVVGHMEEKFKPLFEKHPVGDQGTMWYELAEEPKVKAEYVEVVFKNMFQNSNKEIIDVSPDPPISDHLPPKEDEKSAIYLPVNVLNGLLEMIKEKFNCVVTTKEAASLTSDQLNGLLPSAGLPAGKKLRAKITQNGAPKFNLGPGQSYLTYDATVNFEADGAQLLSVNMKYEVQSNFDIESEKLKINLESSTGRVTEVSSSNGNIDVEPLKEYLPILMGSTCIPKDNGLLEKNRFTLPSLLGATYSADGTKIAEAENTLILYVQTEAPDEAAIQATLKAFKN